MMILYPYGLRKALTLSYDDGVETDIELIRILDEYGILATFNLNSGWFAPEGTVYPAGTIYRRMSESAIKALYAGGRHEVASHALTHASLSQTFADDDILAMYQEKRQANEEGQDYADVQAAAAAEAAAAAAKAPVTFLQDAVVVDDQTALAWIMWNDGSWALTHSVGDTYNADAISEGLVATNAVITGEGKYTVGLDFTGTAQGYSASVAFAAIGISNGEALYPNYLVNIKEVRINGEIYRLKGRAYTTSDDGVCTRVNLYNEWVTSVPKTARLPGGNLAGATPTPINRNDAVIAEIKTIEIDFEYVPMN